jgi:hypothetical protein
MEEKRAEEGANLVHLFDAVLHYRQMWTRLYPPKEERETNWKW